MALDGEGAVDYAVAPQHAHTTEGTEARCIGPPSARPKKPRGPRAGLPDGPVVVDVDAVAAAGELLEARLVGPEVLATATAAAPAPVPRISAKPAAVLVSRERRGLRRPDAPGGGAGVNGYTVAS